MGNHLLTLYAGGMSSVSCRSLCLTAGPSLRSTSPVHNMSNIFNSEDTKLIEKFVQGSNQLLSNEHVRLETSGNVSQVITRSGDILAIMHLQSQPRTALVKVNSGYLERIDRHLLNQDFVLIGEAKRAGYLEYHQYVTPAGYKVHYTEPAQLWKKWWPTERFQNKQRFNMNILVRMKDNWYPVQDILVHAGTFTIKTLSGQLEISGSQSILWLSQIPAESKTNPKTNEDAWNQAPEVVKNNSRQEPAAKPVVAPPAPPSFQQTISELEARLYKQQRATIAAEQRAIRAEQQVALAQQKIDALQKQVKALHLQTKVIH